MTKSRSFDYNFRQLLGKDIPIFGCTDPSATNYDPSATVNDGSCTYPPPPPSVLSVGIIEMPIEASGEYDYVGGSPEKWVSRYDGMAEIYFDDVKGYWVLEWSGGSVLRNFASDSTQPPRFNWQEDGGSLGSNIYFSIAYGDDDPGAGIWSGRWVTSINVSGAGDSNYDGTYTPFDNAGDNWRFGSPMYYNGGSGYLYPWTDRNTIFDWLIGPNDNGANPQYYNSDDPYLNESYFIGATWLVGLGSSPAPSVN
jgi:hypothetical protein